MSIISKNEIYTQWVKVSQKLISFHPEIRDIFYYRLIGKFMEVIREMKI